MSESQKTRGERCPECKGWGTVETGGYENDGHGRQEYVYLGRWRCEMCDGKGIIPLPTIHENTLRQEVPPKALEPPVDAEGS